MKNSVHHALLALDFLCSDGWLCHRPAPVVSAVPEEQAISSAVGVWSYTDVVGNATARTNFYKFAATHPIRQIHLEAESSLSYNQDKLASFIQDASAHQMRVDLLTGYSQWALTGSHAQATGFAQKAVDFTLLLKSRSQIVPTSLHLDVEPYLLSAWTTDQQGTANQYLDMLAKVKQLLGSALSLTVDIPCWFDEIQVTRLGITRPLSEWVLDTVDTAVLMDYRDTAQGIINSGYSEIQYASRIGKKVSLGTNTKCEGAENNSTTFCEEGTRYMEKTLNTVQQKYSAQAGYGGLSVFTYEDYKKLGK